MTFLLLENAMMDYTCTVTVSRPAGSYDEHGNYMDGWEDIITEMPADIQLSLKIRQLVSMDESGVSDTSEWVMYCTPDEEITRGDRVADGERTFIVDAVADWGTHAEVVMRGE
jgi:head-tail adaptor